MRVIAGIAKGRRLRSPPGRSVRPTADRVKEALFSMLESRFDLTAGALLDLFAGSGGLGIEGLSRGAPRAVFVEPDRGARQVLAANLDTCGFRAAAELWPVPARRALRELAARGARFAGVLLDPPYGRGLAGEALAEVAGAGILQPDAWIAVEHRADEELAPAYGSLRLTAVRRYGKTALALYSSAQMTEPVTAW